MKNSKTNELIAVIAIQTLAWAAFSVLTPIIPLYLTSIDVSPSLIGAMLAISTIGMVAGESAGGWIADKLSLKIPFGIGTFFCIPLVILLGFSSNIPFLILIFLLWGIARAAIFGPGRGYIANASTFSNKTALMGIFMSIQALGGSLGSLASGFIADHLGYSWDFYLSAGLSMIAGILIIAGLPNIHFFSRRDKSSTPAMISPPNAQHPTTYRACFYWQCAISMLYWWGSGAMSFLPLLATEVAGVGPTQIGILFTIIGIVEAIFYIPLGRLADKKGKKAFMLVGLTLLVFAFCGLALVKNFPLLIVFSLLISLSLATFSPAALALISDTVPAFWQNTAMGIYGSAEDIGVVLGSGIGGVAWSAFGQLSFLLAGATGVVGAIICVNFLQYKVVNIVKARHNVPM